MTRIQELAGIISTNTDRLNQFWNSQGQRTPSFDIDGPEYPDLPTDLQLSRDQVIDATTELKELLQGPRDLLLSNSANQLISLRAIYHYKLAEAFPVGSEATFVQISDKCGLNEPDVRRILRHAMAHQIFREVRKGVVAHTGVSQILAQSDQLKSWLGVSVEEMWPSAVQTVPAMVKWPNSQEPTHTGFSIANNTTNPIYMEFAKNPERAARFGKGMSAFISSAGYELHHIVEHELWSSIGNGVVVDVGGSHGDVMIALAKRHPSLNLIVQDLSSTIQSRPSVPSHGKNVKFMSHDFFTEQPVKNADIYYFRWIFHNWSNGYSLRILRNLIPALKPQSKIVINDACLPEPNTLSLTAERRIRAMDLSMLQIQNSRERERQDWETLFKEADPRFKFLGVQQPRGSKLAIIQASWEPTE